MKKAEKGPISQRYPLLTAHIRVAPVHQSTMRTMGRIKIREAGKLHGETRGDFLKSLLLEDGDLLSLNLDDPPVTKFP